MGQGEGRQARGASPYLELQFIGMVALPAGGVQARGFQGCPSHETHQQRMRRGEKKANGSHLQHPISALDEA